MALHVFFCKDSMVNVEISPVRTFTLFPKHVTITPRYGQLVLGNTLKTRRVIGTRGSIEKKVCSIEKPELSEKNPGDDQKEATSANKENKRSKIRNTRITRKNVNDNFMF